MKESLVMKLRQLVELQLAEQRARAKADARSRKRQLADTSVYRDFRAQGETIFTGYSDLETESTVLGLLVDGLPAQRATTGQIAEVILAEKQRVLWQHVQELTPRCRELLRVIAFSDRADYTQLAQALGMPVGSIGPTRGRCLGKLRTSLTADPRWEQ